MTTYNFGSAVAKAKELFDETGDFAYFRADLWNGTAQAFTVRRYDWKTRHGWEVDYRVMTVEFREDMEYRCEQLPTDIQYFIGEFRFVPKSLLLKESSAASDNRTVKSLANNQQTK